MKYELIIKAIEGTRTLEEVERRLKVDRARAIYLIHRLRKLGYIRTKYLSNKKRIYSVSPLNKQNGTSYLESFNKNMPNPSFKMNGDDDYFVHGRKIKAEDELIYALKKNEVRFVISSLYLFRRIENWSHLYRLAKEENLTRKISALYDVARLFVRKVRKMPKRFRNLTEPKKDDKFIYVIKGFNSDDFRDIEKKWKVYIPLNRADLQEYVYLKHDKHK
jgi:hypothetical protein